jgi:predicted lipid-binding transport protein (Tim44 family)
MRKLLSIFVAMIGLSLVAIDAEAKRVGGGRSVGTQRSITPQQAAPKAPAQQQATPNTPAQQAQAAPGATPPKPASGMSKWLGPLAGLAIGAGLASLFMGNGLGGALGGILLMLAIVVGVVFLVRMFRGRGAHQQQQPLRYAGATAYGGVEPTASPAPAPAPSYSGGGAAPHSVAATVASPAPAAARRWPADFDADEFARHAKANFLKVQEANDRKDLGAISDFLTPALAAEIEADMRAAGDAPQKTDVVTLEAEVLDVVTEERKYIVSVRFSGLIRETPGTEPQPFSEIWHLEKPLDGRSGWQVAGIQQA